MAQARELELEGHPHHDFHHFTRTHDKKYSGRQHAEEAKKKFNVNVEHIVAHNEKHRRGEKSYHLGVNYFADLTHEEFKEIYSVKLSTKAQPNAGKFPSKLGASLPPQVDWSKQGYVTPVKNQGSHGTCWTFSATGALEGQHYKATGKLVSLSEQQIVDCCVHGGVEGGNPDMAFEYIKSCGGLETEDKYPYVGQKGYCLFDKSLAVVSVKEYHDIESGSEEQLQEAVATVGPVSVAIDASHRSFQLYAGGVYDEPDGSPTNLDHAVLVVGYGTENGKDFWLVKNSWGDKWGENGYIKMSRNKKNQCGIATVASYPLIYEQPGKKMAAYPWGLQYIWYIWDVVRSAGRGKAIAKKATEDRQARTSDVDENGKKTKLEPEDVTRAQYEVLQLQKMKLSHQIKFFELVNMKLMNELGPAIATESSDKI